MNSRLAIATLILTVIPTLVLAQQPPMAVLTGDVKRESVQEHRRVTGSLQAISRSSIASQEAGQVLEILTDEGMTVREGDVVARLDARRLEAQLAEGDARVLRFESDLAVRQSELSFAEFDARRLAKLHEGKVASSRESLEASTRYEAAQARVEEAQRAISEGRRQVDLLRIRLGDMTVRAPYDARVVRRHVDPGEWIDPGEPIITLVSTGAIEARLEVPERYAQPLVSNGNRITAEVVGLGRSATSQAVRIVPDVDPQSRMFSIVLTLDNADELMSPGMSVIAWIPTTGLAEHLTVPRSAVVRSAGDSYVYRSTPDANGTAKAERLPVTVLFDWQDRVVVSAASLHDGDRVIVEGNERIMPGAELAMAHAQKRDDSNPAN